jgi:hypothetical protein
MKQKWRMVCRHYFNTTLLENDAVALNNPYFNFRVQNVNSFPEYFAGMLSRIFLLPTSRLKLKCCLYVIVKQPSSLTSRFNEGNCS